MGLSSHHSGIRGNSGHSPVGGDSLLMAQAGGGSCTRSGELKLRRKEEDCGGGWGRERAQGGHSPLRVWPSPSPSTIPHEEPALRGTHSPTCQAWEHQPAISVWFPLTVLPGHCWWEISSEHQRWTLTLHVLHRKPCLEFPGKNVRLARGGGQERLHRRARSKGGRLGHEGARDWASSCQPGA